MDTTETIHDLAEMLWELFADGDAAAALATDPEATLAEHGLGDVSPADLQAAYHQIADRLPPEQQELARVVTAPEPGALEATPVARPAFRSAPEQQHHTSPAPEPSHHGTDPSTSHDVTAPESAALAATSTIVNNTYVTNQTIDNDTITRIYAEGDVEFDQEIDNDIVMADDGGVAVGGDLEDGVVNTGTNTGVIAGDDADLEDSVVGNGNTQINDSEVGAFADHGEASNIEADGNVNTGAGDVVDVDSHGDAQVATGNGNEITGDVDVDASGAAGPVNVAVGDANEQQAIEDLSTDVEGSYNTDNSVEDVGNVAVEDSFDETIEDNDTMSTTIEGSFDSSAEDNDSIAYEATASYDDHSSFSDDDSTLYAESTDLAEADIYGDDNSLDMELDG
jgi:hypothetical protein